MGLGLNNSFKGMFNGDFFKEQNLLSDSDISAIKAYNAEIDKCVTSQTAFNRTMLNTSQQAQNVVAAANGNKVALEGMTKASKAAELGMKALSIAGNMIATMAISWVLSEAISWLNDLAHAEENARKRSEELTSSYEDEKKNIDDSIAKYKELNDKLQDNSLSTSEVYDMKSQLKDIQDKLIESFGNEADGIDLVNGKYDEQIAKLDTLSKQKATDYVAENNANIKSDEDYVYGKIDDFYPYVGRSKDFDYKLDDNTIKEIFDKYDKVGIAINEGVYHLTANGTREEVHKQLVDIYNELDEFKDNPALQKFKTNISTIVSDKTFFDSDQLEKSKNNLKKYAEAEILKDDNTRKAYSDLTDAVDKYNQALEDGIGVEDAENNLLTAKKSAEDSAEEISNAGDVFQDVYNQISGSAPIDVKKKFGLLTTDEEKEAEQNAQKLADTYQKTINRFPTNKAITQQDVTDAKAAVQEEYDKIHDWGLDSYADQIKNGTIQSKYGNVDMDNRQIINWNIDNIEKWKDALSDIKYYDKNGNFIDSYYDQLKESAKKGESNIDTVFGDMMDHIEGYGDISSLAFSHVVDNDDGTFEFLGQKTAEEYIYGILDQAKKDGDLSIDHILELDKQGYKNAEIYDAQGKKVGQSYIHGIIAGFNSNSEDISKLMHMSGKYGAPQIARRDARKVESQYGNNEQDKIKNFLDENGISDNQALLDEFNQVTEGITNADEAILQWKIHQEQAAKSFSTAWNDLKTLSESSDDSTDKEDKAAKTLYKSLTDLADKGELTIDTFRKVDGAENYFDSLGISAGQAVNQINQLSDKNSQVSAMRKNIQAMSEALYSKQTDGFATAEDFAGFDATIKGLDSWKEFSTLLGDAKSSMEDCQTVANKLATEYVNSNEVICQLDDSTAEYFRTQMTSMGVSNADAVVQNRLNYLHTKQAEGLQECVNAGLQYNDQKITSSNYSDMLASATANEISALANEAIQSGNSADALAILAVKKAVANGTTLSTAGDIQNLADLANVGTEVGKLLNRLAQLKNGFTNGEPSEAIEKETESITSRIMAMIGGGGKTNVTVIPQATTNNKKSNSGGSGSSTKKKTPLEKLQDWLSTLFDWIEIKLERQTDKISKYISRAESQLDDKKYSSSAKNYNNAIDATNVQVGYEETARDKYYAQASKILDKAVAGEVISQKTADIIATRVADGSMNISEYSDEIREVISAYQEWYNKGKDASDALEELHKNIRTYIQDLKDVRDKQRDAKIDSITGYNDIATSTVANSARAKNSQLNASNSSLGKQNATYRDYVQNVTRDTNGVAASANGSVTNAIKGTKDAKYRTALLNAQKAIKNKTAVSDADLSTISAHSTYVYNRLYAYNVALDNAETARMEYATAYSSNYTDAIKNITEKYSNKDDATNDAMDLNSSKSDNAVTAKIKNKYLNKQASGYDTIAKNNQAEIDQYASSVKSARKTMNKSATATAYNGLGSKGQKAVSNVVEKARSQAKSKKPISASLISKITEYYKRGYISRSFYESCIRYNNARESLDQARKQAEIDKQTALTQKAELAQQKFSNISTEMDNKRHKYEQTATELNAKMSLYEERGNGASANWYVRLQKTEQKEYDSLIEKRKKQIKELDDSVANGSIKKGSTEWHDMKSQIDDTTNSINDAKKALAEYNNQILQVHWDRVDEYVSKLQNLTTETDFVINELSRKDLTSDKTGGLTKEGNAVAGLHVSNYKVYQTEAKKYQSEIKKINKQLADDPYNQKLIAHKEELVKSYQDAIAGAQDEKYAVIDLIENGYASLKNHISDLIDQYNDLISSEKNAYDYANNISDKTQQIANIRKQLQAYSGDVSEEARAKVQELNVSLKDAEKDLKDTQFDQYVSATQDMLSDFQDDLDESIQNIIDTLDDKFKGLIDTINENWSSDNNIITKTLSTIGYSATKDGLKMYANGDITKNTTDAVNGVKSFLEKAWTKYDKTAHDSQTTGEKEKELKQKQEQIDALNQQIKALKEEKVTSKAQKQDVANRIKNLQDQIKELKGNKSGNSSGETSSSGEGNGSKNKSTSKTTSSKTDAGKKLSKSRIREIQNFINSNLINPAKGKKISDYDAFNQAIWKSYGDKTGKILSKEALQHLANLTGYAFSNKATSPFWQTLHKSGIKGFRRGSESIPYDMIANLGEDGTELQYDVSKGVLKSVGQNDMIFTAEQAKTLMDFAKNPMMFSNMYTGNAFRMPNMPVTNRTDNDINITIGDVNLEGVQNPQQFASSMKDAIKNNTGGVRNMIKDTTVGSLSPNHNSLGIRKY